MKTALTIIIIMLALLFLQRECNRTPRVDPVPDTIRITTIEYDSVLIEKQIPKPYPVEKIVFLEIPTDIDTSAILLDYFTKNIYDRILMDDTTALIRLIDTVHQNQLRGSKLEYRNRQPVTINETYVIHPAPPQRIQLYAGGFIEGNTVSLGAGPTLFAKTKRDHIYGLGYDAVNKNAQVHMLWKLSFRKE